MALNSSPRPIRYDVLLDPDQAQRGAQKVARALQDVEAQAQGLDRALGDIRLDVDADTDPIDALRRRLLAKKAEIEDAVRYDVELDPTKALYDLRRVERQLKDLDRMDVRPEVKVDVDGGVAGLATALNLASDAVGGLLGPLSKMPPQAAAAVAAVAAIGGALAAPVVVGTVGGILAAGVAKAGFGLLEAFDEAEKARRKAKIVFGDQLADMQAWAEGVSYNVGLGTRDVVAAASTIQDLLVPRGFSRTDAADITRAVYERGAAIAEFAGRDTTEGIDAVTKALLGQGKSLTMMGVEIRKADVKRWIKDNADEVKGLNDKQKEVVATLALIEANSTDAWASFQKGAGTADEVLDTLAATFANTRETLVQGFGSIFVGVVDDILGVTTAFDDLGDAPQALGEWIDANADGIRTFMFDLAGWAVLGAESFIAMGEGALTMAEWLARSVPDVLRFAAAGIDLSEKMGALVALMSSDIGSQQFRDAWRTLTQDASSRVQELEDAADQMEQRLNGWNLDPAKNTLAGVGEKLAGVRDDIERLAAADELRVQLGVTLDEDGKATVAEDLRTLTDQQLSALIEVTDGQTVSEVDQKINRMAEKERRARIKAIAENTGLTEKQLDALATDRTANIFARVQFDRSKLPPWLGGTAALASGPAGRAAAAVGQFGRTSGDGGTVAYQLPAQVALRQVNVNIVNNYPEPERASESLAMNLRLVREAVA